jgi:hypothetical protein
MSVTAHYIWIPEDDPHAWQLKAEQLAYKSFEGHHSGANIAQVLFRIIQKYGLEEKVCLFNELCLSCRTYKCHM